MMVSRVLRAVLPVALAGGFGLPLAHADIYTWIDASGVTNVSNLPPPEGVQVTKILHGRPPEIVAREDAARDAARQAEAQALVERVRQLEDEVAARQAPPPMVYAPPPPPVIQYIVEAPAPQIAYVAQPTPSYSGCDPSWAGCALSWFSGFYPASVLVVPGFRPVHPFRPHNPMHPPRSPFALPKLPDFTAQLPTQPFGPAPGPKRG
jgi:hypothetical protein